MMNAAHKPGDIVVHDFRDAIVVLKPVEQLKCIQWNIERGYQLDDIVKLLISYDADIICLQELDVGCERSRGRNCALELAESLKMKCAFVVEFEEIYSSSRPPLLQGGGVHGNAILSRFDFEAWIVRHSYHPVNWERDGGRLYGEPRKGERAVIAAAVSAPGIGQVVCYSLHLEVFCGIFGRVKQYADVLEDCRVREKEALSAGALPLQLIFGDLNTMAHGIARLSPKYCCDSMRIMSFGQYEGSWWDYNIFMQNPSPDETNPQLARYVPKYLTSEECVKLRKDMLFIDPFSIASDITVQNHAGLYSGKLDWTLCRNFDILEFGMDNHDFSMSDHKMLYVVIKPVNNNYNKEGGGGENDDMTRA
jgi:endonuclease/exonuclease/phosphatase family metal-dependent hydrolase